MLYVLGPRQTNEIIKMPYKCATKKDKYFHTGNELAVMSHMLWSTSKAHHGNYIDNIRQLFEAHHEKTFFLYVRKQRRRSAVRLTAQLISPFVFVT